MLQNIYQNSKQESRLVFSAWVWLFFVLFLLSVFSISQVFPLVVLIGILVSVVMFVLPFWGGGKVEVRLIYAAVSFGVLITALYPPFVGLFMSLEGGANSFFVKILLGVRSAFFSLWVSFAFFIFAFRENRLLDYVSLVYFAILMVVGLAFGGGGIEPKVTYLLNSFLSLFAVFGIVFYILKNTPELHYLDSLLQRVVLLLVVFCILYFPVLILNLDVFRPDMALMHQSIERRGVGGSLPPQWQSLLYDMFVPRFVGSFPNPILFGYFCAILSFVFFVKKRFYISGLLIALIVVSLSKGALLLLLSAHIFRFFLKRGKTWFFASAMFLLALEFSMAYVLDGSNRVHLRGLLGGIQSVFLGGVDKLVLGFGFGSGGNMSRAELVGGATSAGWLASGSESGIGTLVYQMGLGGFLYFLFLSFRILKFSPNICRDKLPEYRSVIALCAAWLLNMLLQEDLINVTISSQMLLAIVMLAGERSETQIRPVSSGVCSGAPVGCS